MRLLRRLGCWLRGHHVYVVGDTLKAKRGERVNWYWCGAERLKTSEEGETE